MVFMGSPGTGKTTVARAMSGILYSLSLKPSNVFVETSGLELTGEHVGQTKTKIAYFLKKAKGGVLFIDEAYSLDGGQYGKEACEALVAAMTSKDFSDVLIIIAGYSSEINKMLGSNSGLKSRFTTFFEFPDWEVDDCVAFFSMCAEKERFAVDTDALDEIRDGCQRLKQLKGWGNGRDVKHLFTQSKENRAERVYKDFEPVRKIVRFDVKAAVNSMLQARIGKLSDPEVDPFAEVEKLFRMKEVKAKILKLQKTWSLERSEGNNTPSLGHFCFTGSPGCGKTTVARAIAKVLFGLELKASDKIIETSAMELTAEYTGQTKKKVERQLQDAKGGVLFIDEAYSFYGQYGQEAIDTLVAAMTSPDYADVLIVIAGYPMEIDGMFQKNPGLKSRFSHFFCFPDWSAEDCVNFFTKCASLENFAKLDDSILETITAGCRELIGFDGWANGRDVKRLWDESKSNRAERLDGHPEGDKVILPRDVTMTIESMIEVRRPKTEYSRANLSNTFTENSLVLVCDDGQDSHLSHQTQSKANKSPRCSAITETQATFNVKGADTKQNECDEQSMRSEIINFDKSFKNDTASDGRDKGVRDEDWEELLLSKESERKRFEEIAKLDEEFRLVRQAAEEARRRHEDELQRIKEEKVRDEQEKARRKAEEDEAKRLREIEDRRQRLKEKHRKQEAIKEKLRSIGLCPAGFIWHKVVRGWRCGGGSHFVSDKELWHNYGVDL